MKISELKELVDRTVTLRLTDGEFAKVFVCFADEEYNDIIVDILETTRPERYRDPSASYTIDASDIISVEAANERLPPLPPLTQAPKPK